MAVLAAKARLGEEAVLFSEGRGGLSLLGVWKAIWSRLPAVGVIVDWVLRRRPLWPCCTKKAGFVLEGYHDLLVTGV